MRGGVDRVGVAAAGLSGLALACVQVRRLTEDQALAEMAQILAELPRERRQEALDRAAAGYLDPGPLAPFHDLAAALLARAGANLDHARQLQTRTGQSFVMRES